MKRRLRIYCSDCTARTAWKYQHWVREVQLIKTWKPEMCTGTYFFLGLFLKVN